MSSGESTEEHGNKHGGGNLNTWMLGGEPGGRRMKILELKWGLGMNTPNPYRNPYPNTGGFKTQVHGHMKGHRHKCIHIWDGGMGLCVFFQANYKMTFPPHMIIDNPTTYWHRLIWAKYTVKTVQSTLYCAVSATGGKCMGSRLPNSPSQCVDITLLPPCPNNPSVCAKFNNE